jgi:hypothetical protein
MAIVEFKLFLYNFLFFGEGTRWKRLRVKESLWK